MTKQRDIFKGRVKRLLREQKDMGQVSEPALQCCVTAIEAFVHDLGTELRTHTEQQGRTVITPIELKQVIMGNKEFAFLQHKVSSIDERDAKYHKTTPTKKKQRTASASSSSRKEKRTTVATKKAPAKAKKAKTAAATVNPSDVETTAAAAPQAVPQRGVKKTEEIEIEEDDDYDESDSD